MPFCGRVTSRLVALVCLAVGVAAPLAGCGGGGGGNSRTAFQIPVDWPARARTLNAPESAQSALVSLRVSDDSPEVYNAFANRGDEAGAHQSIAKSVQAVPNGVYRMRVNFFTKSEGAGDVVATATAIVQVKGDGTLRSGSGEPLGAIAVSSNITGLFLQEIPRLPVGATAELGYAAYSDFNQVIAVDPRAIRPTVVTGGEHLQVQDGMLRAVSPGEATVTVSLDGRVSNPQTVTVTEAGFFYRPTDVSASGLVYRPQDGRVYATVGGAAERYGNSLVAIDPATGNVVSSVSVGSNPTGPAISADGHFIYAFVADGHDVVKVDVQTMTRVSSFTLGINFFGQPLVGRALDVSPVDPNLVAVAVDDNTSAMRLYQDGVALPNNGSGQDIGLIGIAFNPSGDKLYASSQFGNGAIFRADFDETGITAITQSNDVQASGAIRVKDGKIFASNGVVIDAASLTYAGRLTTQDNFGYSGEALDATAPLAWVLTRDRIVAFHTTSLAQVGSFRVDPFAFNTGALVRFGAKGLAYIESSDGSSGSAKVMLLSHAPGL
jgi:hypothetical protein